MTARPEPVLTAVPQDVRAEAAFLGAVLDTPTALVRVADRLTPEDFTHDAHRWIWAAMLSLYRRTPPAPPDEALLAGLLAERGQLAFLRAPVEVTNGAAPPLSGELYLLQLRLQCPSPWAVGEYADRIVETATARRLISLGGQIAGLGYAQDRPLATRLGEVRALVGQLVGRGGGPQWISLADALSPWYDALAGPDTGLAGIPTGLEDLDVATEGWQAGDLIIPAAPTSGGKSALTLSMALVAAAAGHPVAIVSLEMAVDRYCRRIMANLSNIPGTILRSGRLTDPEWEAVNDAVGKGSQLPIHLMRGAGLTFDALWDKALEWQALLPPGGPMPLLIVDYLQLINRRGIPADRDEQAVARVAEGLKALAGLLDCPILAPSQLNEQGQLRDSKAIGFAADVVLKIEATLDPRTTNAQVPVPVDLVLEKQRDGGKGVIEAQWDLRTNRFYPRETRRTFQGSAP